MNETFGGWQLERLLAVGGLGEIWYATRDDTYAALKRLHTHLVRIEEARAMFEMEQQVAVAVPRHPNLVHGHEVGHVDGRPFVVLDMIGGQDLRHLLTMPDGSNVVLPRIRALSIVRKACAGVAHLHKFKYVHGDINPGNLMVDEERVVVVDLSIVRKLGEGGPVRGTHAYMAPEQIQGKAWTPATDVFALGVVLWELVAGARLFHRGPPWLSMAAVMEQPVPPLPDRALDTIAQAALAKDPGHRIQTATELADRLVALVS